MVSKEKKQAVETVVTLLDQYPVVAAVNLENLPAAQLQNMRGSLRGKIVLFMTKKRLMDIALDMRKDKIKGIEILKEHLKGMPALLFTKENPFSLYKTIKKNKSKAPAKGGQKAPHDIEVKAGPTNFLPGPIIGELGQLRIKSGVENGKVVIKQDSIVVEEGDVISSQLASLLLRLGIEPMEVGLDITAAFEHGVLYTKNVLDIDETAFMSDLTGAARKAVNLSVFTGFPTVQTVPIMLAKASQEALALGMSATIFVDPLILKHLVTKAARQAKALSSTANVAVEEEEEIANSITTSISHASHEQIPDREDVKGHCYAQGETFYSSTHQR